MTKDTIQSNIYKGQLNIYSYLNKINVVPYEPNNNIISLKTYILAPNFHYINQRLNPNNKLTLLIKAIEHVENKSIDILCSS